MELAAGNAVAVEQRAVRVTLTASVAFRPPWPAELACAGLQGGGPLGRTAVCRAWLASCLPLFGSKSAGRTRFAHGARSLVALKADAHVIRQEQIRRDMERGEGEASTNVATSFIGIRPRNAISHYECTSLSICCIAVSTILARMAKAT